MRGSRTLTVAAAAVSFLIVAPSASAHPPTSFATCASEGRADEVCEETFFGRTGSHLWVRARMRPVHATWTAVVLSQRPGSSSWTQVATVPISENGKMRYRWTPAWLDAHPTKPYRIKFKVLGHGASEDAHVYVSRSAAGSAVHAAYSVLGTRYRKYSSDPDLGGLDCSGLTEWAWEQAGVDMPGGASIQYKTFRRVNLSRVLPGDLVYYGGSGAHIAIAIGNREIIPVTGPGHAGRTRIDSLFGYDKPWGAVRVS